MEDLTFIDLFCGIGGFRLAMERNGCKCLFSCDSDKHARATYSNNFGDEPHQNVRLVSKQDVPPHHILCAGFPCQPFSLAGVSKRKSMGVAHGFDDSHQGNLFFDLLKIANFHQTPVLFLENVKNLKSHDGGRTFKTICRELTLSGYSVSHKIIDARVFVPQHRERIFIVCLRGTSLSSAPLWGGHEFSFPDMPKMSPKLGDILEENVDEKYTLSDKLWGYLQQYAAKHLSLGHGFGYGLCGPGDVTRTLSARYWKDGSEILVRQDGRNPRRLTPRECARIQGFPESFKLPTSDAQAYKQFGNSVAVPLIQHLGKAIVGTLKNLIQENHHG